jgi:ATP-dependent Clp protease ATP-binding subunit ClpC
MLGSVFERFTEEARQVVVHAQEETLALRQSKLGTEHLLLGLLRVENTNAARLLKQRGVTIERVRGLVIEIVGAGESEASGSIPFTPDAKNVLDAAVRASVGRRIASVGPEHLLLGLVSDEDSVGARILLDLDADGAALRDAIDRLVVNANGWP